MDTFSIIKQITRQLSNSPLVEDRIKELCPLDIAIEYPEKQENEFEWAIFVMPVLERDRVTNKLEIRTLVIEDVYLYNKLHSEIKDPQKFIEYLNKEVFYYIQSKIKKSQDLKAWDSSNIWFEPYKKFLKWFDLKDIDPESIQRFFTVKSNVNTIKPAKLSDGDEPENIFRFYGTTWTVRYDGLEKTIKHTKGMDYIAYLFRHQGQEIHSMKLYQTFTEETPDTDRRMSQMVSEQIESDEGLYKDGKVDYKMLTPEALEGLKGHLDKLKIDQNKAMMENNSLEEESKSKEIDVLDKYIKANTNEWGKIRDFSDPTEKMRISINKAIKIAKNNIDKMHKELFSHIDKYLETGTYNIYRPETPINWVQDN